MFRNTNLQVAIASLLIMLIQPAVASTNFNPDRWDAFCETNKDKCERAISICEQNEKIDCDAVKAAFMEKKPLKLNNDR